MFHTKTEKQTILELKTDIALGLSEQEAKVRQNQYGKNILSEAKSPSGFLIFAKQFNNFFTIILLVAALLSLLLKEHFDLAVILVAISFNLIVGFIQEFKAAKTVFSLRQMVVVTAKALRNGRVHKILAENLVPGDIVFLDAGDKIPTDGRLLEAVAFQTKEAILTGEATPSKKHFDKLFSEKTSLADRENMVYMGTIALSGKAKMVVTSIGKHTEMGQIASMVVQAEEKPTPLQAKMKTLSLQIAMLVFACLLIIMFLGLSKGKSIEEMFLTTIALAVAAIPEGLLVSVMVILTLSMRRILQKKALVRELLAAETLGSTTVICTDKTGTLTTGEMSVEQIVTSHNVFYKHHFKNNNTELLEIFKVGLLCNDVYVENESGPAKNWKFLGDPTETALLYAAAENDLKKEDFEKQYPLLDEIPFDSYMKYMAAARKNNALGNAEIFVKGSCERLVNFSSEVFENENSVVFDSAKKDYFLKMNSELSGRGYRVLACAKKITKLSQNIDIKKEATSSLLFLGLVAIRDPLRKGVDEAIKTCLDAGIKIKMITGDHKKTAQAIGHEVGIIANETEILTGEEMDLLPPAELSQKICQAKIFARVAPKHKLQIVEALQERNEVVAMTGDGVNDTPALKAANIGIAMGQGAEAAKETANMILLDNNFKTIERAVEEGRIIFDNIRKVTLYLLLYALSKVILIGGALLFGLPLPLLPVQILWMNIIEDGLPDFALAFEKGEKGTMQQKPKSLNEQILDRKAKFIIFLVGVPTAFILFALYYYLAPLYADPSILRTLIFATLALTSVITAYSCRNMKGSIFHKDTFSNKFLNLAVFFSIALLALALYVPFLQNILKTVPLGIYGWLFAISFALLNIVAIEIIKKIFNRKNKNGNTL